MGGSVLNIWMNLTAAIVGMAVVVNLILALKSRKFFRSLFLNALLGVAVLAAIDLTTRFTGVHIPVNEWTVGSSAVLGLPAVAGFLLLPLILG